MTITTCQRASTVEECWKSNGRTLRRGIPQSFITVQAFSMGVLFYVMVAFCRVVASCFVYSLGIHNRLPTSRYYSHDGVLEAFPHTL